MNFIEQSQLMKEEKISLAVKHPFAELPVGLSFTVPIEGTKESSLRTSASMAGKKLGKVFKVIKHLEFGVFEIGCVGERK